jgi:hypothetical protein
MKRHSIVTLLCIAAMAPAAWAGTKGVYSVYVSTTGKYAEGAIGSARNSADAYQQLGCGLTAYSAGTPSGYCYARDASGVSAMCNTSDPGLVAQIQSVSTDGYLRFNWDASGYCTSIFHSKFSSTETKVP